MKQKLTELQLEESTIITGNFNTPLLEMEKSSRQQTGKDIVELNSSINQLDIIDIYRLLPPTIVVTHSSQNHMEHSLDGLHLGHKTHLTKFKRREITQCLFSDHKGIKLEINNIKIAGKPQNTWRLNNMLLNNTWIKEFSRESKKYF